MNTIEHHFHGATAVHILLKYDAWSASRLTGTWRKSPERLGAETHNGLTTQPLTVQTRFYQP